MKRSVIFLCLLSAVVSTRVQAQEVLAEDVAPPFVVPMTEGLFRIFSAEPLGKKGFNIRYLNEAYKISVDKVGTGTSLTGHAGLGYGIANGVDFAVSMPLMLDIAGDLTKYGTGDITTSLKFGLPGRFPSAYYFGLDISVTHPYGYIGREALKVRPFTRTSREISSRLLLDINREAIGFRFNLGYLASSQIRQAGPLYGAGVEIGRGQILTVTGEYWNEPSAIGERSKRAVLGAHLNLWWLRLQAGVEKGLSKDLPNLSTMAGIQIHTSLGGKRKKSFGGRTRRVSLAKDTETSVRIAIVDFSGFEDRKAGTLLANKIATVLSRYGHIRIVDVDMAPDFLAPDAALTLSDERTLDVVITGRILRSDVTRSARPNVPLVVGFPQTVANMEADVRVVDVRKQGEVFSLRVTGTGRQSRGIRLFPTSKDDRTSYLNALERERIWEEANGQAVAKLMMELAQNFDWLPE
ncbi:MAG TPA: hypothetical protein DIU35_08610 [Candidatus Latescibacteria bacterium]|nr:hypothetical protein [Candidatus Latescibacterota bacterium]|tara:strand:- start:977 stop:2371 length:1395 start_codon:yes stop_codon:yes gene_type:complete